MRPLELARKEKSEYTCIATCARDELSRQVDLAYRLFPPPMEIRIVKVNRRDDLYHVQRRDDAFMNPENLEERGFEQVGETDCMELGDMVDNHAQSAKFAEFVALAKEPFGLLKLYVRSNL